MKLKRAFVLLNGLAPSIFPDLSNYDLICAIDGAYNHFESKNIFPDLVTGDFDSIHKIPNSVEVINTPNQDYTDFEKALTILKERGFGIVDVYGGSGKEHDHFLGNISTALYWKNELKITFYDDFGKFFFIEKTIKLTNVKGHTVSLIPFPMAKGIHSQGLQFSLINETLTFGKRIGTRNRASKNEVEISYKSGELLIYVSNN